MAEHIKVQLPPNGFKDVQAGDKVRRMFGGGVEAGVFDVTYVDDRFLYLSPPGVVWPQDQCWKFWRDIGTEVDEALGWDGIKCTGSYLTEVVRGPAAQA